MNKNISIAIVLLLLVLLPNAYGNAELQTLKQFSDAIEDIRNPFEEQLPVKIEPVVEIPDIAEITNQEIDLATLEEEEARLEEQKIQEEQLLLEEERLAEEKLAIESITLPPLDINGLVWNTTRPQAIINGVVLDVGDSIFEITITSINKSLLEVTYQGANFKIVP